MSQRKNGKVKSASHYCADIELPGKQKLCIKVRNSIIKEGRRWRRCIMRKREIFSL